MSPGENVHITALSCYLSGWVLGQAEVQSAQGDRRREWRGLGQLEEPWSSDTTAGVWARYKIWTTKKKQRKHYRLWARIIYIIDRRCRPPLITAGISMISPKIETRRGHSLRQTKDVCSEKKEKSVKDHFWQRQTVIRKHTCHFTHLFSFSSMYSWSDTSGNWTTLTRTGLELCRSLLTSWTLRSWLQISPVTWRRT